MSTPRRLKDEHPGTFFVTANIESKRRLLQSDRSAELFIEVLLAYRDAGEYLLHEFTVMPNHIHVLLTPVGKVSRAVSLIKGRYSFEAGRQSGWKGEIWQRGFSEHCVRGAADYSNHRKYIYDNAVKAGLAAKPADFRHCSACGKFRMDPNPFIAG
ncbi:MAG: transposase [Acidobacteriales bacterium]|nr:transposase [Terriglobales bacterium]